MLSYNTLKERPRDFLAATGLTLAEFQQLLPAFQGAYAHRYPYTLTRAGKPRQRRTGGGAKGVLQRFEAPHSLNQFPLFCISSCRYRDGAKPSRYRIACCNADKGVSQRRISSPVAVWRMVSDTPGNAFRIRSAVGVLVIFFPFSGCTPGR